MTVTYERLEGIGYAVLVDGKRVGRVQRVRVAIPPTGGSRIRSGEHRTVWKIAGSPEGQYPTRKAATEALLRHDAKKRAEHDRGERWGEPMSMGKTRKVNRPYAQFESADGWTWRVLKAYTRDPLTPFARWFCAVKSPMTFGSYDVGDTYVADVIGRGRLTYVDPEVSADEVGQMVEVEPRLREGWALIETW